MKSIGSLAVIAVLALEISARAENHAIESCPLPAYAASCQTVYWPGFEGPYFNLPVGTVCCNPGGVPWGDDCITPTVKGCLRIKAATDICLGCLNAGSPINLSTGNTYIVESDVSLPGLGGGLRLTRTWNSIFPATQAAIPNMFGINWRSTYEERLIFSFTADDPTFKYARGDGSVWSFALLSINPNVYQPIAPANDTTTITQGSPNYTMTFKSGEKRLFDASSGLLVSMIDRNGNTTQLTYDAQGRLATATDAASRQMNFTYVSSSSNLVSAVTTSAGISYAYSYDTQGRLAQVTKPDSTTINFAYDSNNRITAVTDSQGKILESHTYDASGRGLSSSRANGVDAVTVTYPH